MASCNCPHCKKSVEFEITKSENVKEIKNTLNLVIQCDHCGKDFQLKYDYKKSLYEF